MTKLASYSTVGGKVGDYVQLNGRRRNIVEVIDAASGRYRWEGNDDYGNSSLSLQQAVGRKRGVICYVGDSNYGGRIGFDRATRRQLRGLNSPSPISGWTHWLMGSSGMTAATVVDSIATGDQAAPPIDGTPGVFGWDGNIWRIVNAYSGNAGGVIMFSLGINDFGLGSVSRNTRGFNGFFEANLKRIVDFLLDRCPYAHILLDMPAPFVGEEWTISGTTTEWTADVATTNPSEQTIDGGAAASSAEIRRCYLGWMDTHPQVSVWDSADLYGTRVDDKSVNGQDPYGRGALLDDSLHVSNLGQSRHIEHISRLMFGEDKLKPDLVLPSLTTAQQQAPWGEYFATVEPAFNVSGDASLVLSALPHSLWTKSDQNSALYTDVGVPKANYEAGLQSMYDRGVGSIKRLLSIQGAVNIAFEATGNIYTATSVTLHTESTNTDGNRRFQVRLNGVPFASLATADRALGARAFIYTTEPQQTPFTYLSMQIPVDQAGGISFNPYQFNWRARRAFFARPNGTGALTVVITANNFADGRLVDGSLVSGFPTPRGMEIATINIAAGSYYGEMTFNTTNFPDGILLKGAANANSSNVYEVMAFVTAGTLVGTGEVLLR